MQLMKLNNVTKIGIGWALAIGTGLYAFVLSKRYIDRQRYESMKVRQRIREANLADYTPTRKFSE